MTNKYQEEAALLVGDLAGTKWEKSVGLIPARQHHTRSSVASYAEDKPISALVYAASAAFIFGALWGIVRRK